MSPAEVLDDRGSNAAACSGRVLAFQPTEKGAAVMDTLQDRQMQVQHMQLLKCSMPTLELSTHL
jgi:hypothetical protein